MSKKLKYSIYSLVGILVVSTPVLLYLLDKYGEDYFHVGSELVMQRFGLKQEPGVAKEKVTISEHVPEKIKRGSAYKPFKDIGATLGELGLSNSIQIMRGATIFDANGDGLLDIYFTHSGRPVAKKTDERDVLLDEKVQAKPAVLYINQGNNAQGEPTYKTIQELVANGNDDNVKQELLIENKYRPRESVADNAFAPGRIGHGAISADFNGDGRPDLYVANTQYGFFTQTEKYALRVYPTQNNLGRKSKQASQRVLIRSDMFIETNMDDGLRTTVTFDGVSEPEGRNSLYINMGDKDGDGIPEWKDVTDRC